MKAIRAAQDLIGDNLDQAITAGVQQSIQQTLK